MTLDFKKLIDFQLEKQMKVQHFQCKAQLFKREELLPDWKITKRIKEIYGQNALLDADWLLFFSGRNLTRDMIKENGVLFKIANAALGKVANSMTPGDFKMINSLEDEQSVESRDIPMEDAVGELVSTPEEDAPADPNSDAIGSVLNESVESPELEEKFIFIKITIK